jgi:hypothetical protein
MALDAHETTNGSWRELHRTKDAREAMTVLTTIAAMEFEVRCPGALPIDAGEEAGSNLGDPPYVIEVRTEDWTDLRGVFASLLEEQEQFEREYEARQARKRRFERWMVVVVALGALITMLLASLGCVEEERSARGQALRSPCA